MISILVYCIAKIWNFYLPCNRSPGFIPIFVLLVSAVIMAVCGILIKKCNIKWLETYAMAISMVGAMVFACIITPLIG